MAEPVTHLAPSLYAPTLTAAFAESRHWGLRPRGKARSILHQLVAMRWLAALTVVLLGLTGCEEETQLGQPSTSTTPCSADSGACPGLPCKDETCGGELRCVNGNCSPPCARKSDCTAGASCADMYTDFGTRGLYCLGQVIEPPKGPQLACRSSKECNQDRAEHCVAGQCRVTCLLHRHCGEVGACTDVGEDTEGDTVGLCEADNVPRQPGQFNSSCVNGNDECQEDFYCISAGEGDLDSYCTTAGCSAEDTCPVGYYCDHRSASNRLPCSDACGITGAPGVADCVPAEEIGDGKPYGCRDGQLELTRCLKKEYCASCEANADCAAFPNQVCAKGKSGQKQCTQRCDPSRNSCPWGSASECAVWDEELGYATCAHRAGSCHQTGLSCDACLDDLDCPNGFCARSDHTGERYCYDASQSCACPDGAPSCTGGGCPTTPGGLEMTCIARSSGAAPDACFGASTDPTDSASRRGCWPQ